MREKGAKIARLLLTTTALVAIGLGVLKIYTHYISIFRSGPLDYIVAVGAIIGGLESDFCSGHRFSCLRGPASLEAQSTKTILSRIPKSLKESFTVR